MSTWGKAFKFFPLKSTFLVSVLIFEVGSLICGAAPNAIALIVGRAIAGGGAAGVSSGCYTIIGYIAQPEKRPAFTGIVGAAYGIASVIGPLLGGVFSDKASWRWCFYINLPIGGVSAFAILFFFKTPTQVKRTVATPLETFLQMDLVGACILMGAIITFILAFQYGGQTHPWNSGVVIGTLVAFLGITIAFIIWERFQSERAMFVPRLMGTRKVLVPALFNLFFSGSYILSIYYLPLYFQSIDGVSPTNSGLRVLPLILGVTIATIVTGGFISKTGIVTPIAVAASVIVTVGAGLQYTFDIGTPSSKWIGYQVLSGLGIGFGVQLPIVFGQATADPADLPAVTAIILSFQVLGASLFLSAAQCAFVNIMIKSLKTNAPKINPLTVLATGATELRHAFDSENLDGVLVSYMEGLKVAFAIGIAVAGLSFLMSLFFPRQKINKNKTVTNST